MAGGADINKITSRVERKTDESTANATLDKIARVKDTAGSVGVSRRGAATVNFHKARATEDTETGDGRFGAKVELKRSRRPNRRRGRVGDGDVLKGEKVRDHPSIAVGEVHKFLR